MPFPLVTVVLSVKSQLNGQKHVLGHNQENVEWQKKVLCRFAVKFDMKIILQCKNCQ